MSEVKQYEVWDSERKSDGVVKMIDEEALPVQNKNRVITKEEYAELFPERQARMIYMRFVYQYPKEVGRKMAKVLLKKYPSLKVIDLVDGEKLDTDTDSKNMSWQALLKRVGELKLLLMQNGIALPKVGVSKKEKQAFVDEAEKLLATDNTD